MVENKVWKVGWNKSINWSYISYEEILVFPTKCVTYECSKIETVV